MIAVDTNVLVRYIVRDDPTQCKKSSRLIHEAFKHNELVFVGLVVLCEAVWVLENFYALSRVETERFLESLLDESRYRIQDIDAALLAFKGWQARKGDFTDLLIGRLAEGSDCSTTYTFDRKLARGNGFTLL